MHTDDATAVTTTNEQKKKKTTNTYKNILSTTVIQINASINNIITDCLYVHMYLCLFMCEHMHQSITCTRIIHRSRQLYPFNNPLIAADASDTSCVDFMLLLALL